MPEATPILQADHLVKTFGDSTALDGLSFAVAQGESLGLLGVNGAGKTTAMNLLLGLTTPTSGTVRIFLHGGKVLAEGTPGDIYERFNRTSLEDLFIGVARGEVDAIGLK